jgi:hypothetical protein
MSLQYLLYPRARLRDRALYRLRMMVLNRILFRWSSFLFGFMWLWFSKLPAAADYSRYAKVSFLTISIQQNNGRSDQIHDWKYSGQIAGQQWWHRRNALPGRSGVFIDGRMQLRNYQLEFTDLALLAQWPALAHRQRLSITSDCHNARNGTTTQPN